MTADDLRAALREAFEAGCEQGSEEATSWEWGCSPRTKRDEAFSDLFEEWNKTDAATILRIMSAVTQPQDRGIVGGEETLG